MLRAGFETTHPATGTRSVLLEGAEERDGRGWVIEVFCPVGAPPHILAHVHDEWSETFEIVEGSAAYRLGGEEFAAEAGDTVVMPPGVPHVHPWNVGPREMCYRQINDFGRADPTAVDDVIGVFATLNGLAMEGRVGGRGLPRNPLQFAATLRTLVRHGGYDAAVPRGVQRLLAGSLGRFAEALGYRGVYDRYLH